MRSTRFSWFTVMVLGLALAACRGDSKGGDGNGDVDAGTDDTVFDVQSESMAVGTPVTLRGVVVTAVDTYGGRTGGFYVQEPEGGAFSGVFVFVPGTVAADLVPGDLVDVLGGVKEEFALSADMTGRKLTEISAPDTGAITVNKVGDGTVPTPPVLLPQDLAADDAEAEKWEGVPITFENVRVFNPLRTIGDEANLLKETVVTGPFPIQSNLTSLDNLKPGNCLAKITGIGDYFFNYKIQPRTPADIVAGGSGCLPIEQTTALCGDNLDNDLNGFVDCADFNCQTGEAAALCTTDTTVTDIQNGTFDPTKGLARLTKVIITGVSFNRRFFWVKDPGAAAVNNGIFAFQSSQGSPVLFPDGEDFVGRAVDVTAQVVEFNGLTELTNITFTAPGDIPADIIETPPALTVELSVLLDDTTEEPYEGVLVTINNVKVVSKPDPGMRYSWTLGAAGAALTADQDIFRVQPDALTDGQCLASVTGIMHYNSFVDPARVSFLPRSAADIDTAVGVCN